MTALTGLGTVTSGSLEWTIAFMFACGFFSASYNGPIYAVIVTIAGAKLRGLAVSMVQLGANLIGVGAGTFLIGAIRSEEHTSELQSLMRISYAVFCLKKKNHTKIY